MGSMKEEITKRVIVLVAVLVISVLVFKLVWNGVVVDVTGFSSITFWQSFFIVSAIRLANPTTRYE